MKINSDINNVNLQNFRMTEDVQSTTSTTPMATRCDFILCNIPFNQECKTKFLEKYVSDGNYICKTCTQFLVDMVIIVNS